MNRCVKKILLSGMIFGLISTVGYCGMFGIFNRYYEENYPIQIVNSENEFRYNFEKEIHIKYSDAYGFWLIFYPENNQERLKIVDYFNLGFNDFFANIKIYNSSNNLVLETNDKAVTHFSSKDKVSVLLIRRYANLKSGNYKVKVSLSSQDKYLFAKLKTVFHISNGGKAK